MRGSAILESSIVIVIGYGYVLDSGMEHAIRWQSGDPQGLVMGVGARRLRVRVGIGKHGHNVTIAHPMIRRDLEHWGCGGGCVRNA